MAKILVIDDSPEIRGLIGDTLRKRGFQTFAAEDGLQGVALARQHLPDLILCDIIMPRLDGFATLAALREHESTAAIPFIFLTGAAEKMNFRQGMELGADDYLTKPFTLSELLAAVHSRLEKQQRLERKAEAKLEELRGSISLALPHEFLTPLNGILGFATLLMEPQVAFKPEEVRDFARNIHDSARRLQRLVENFLVYSQILVLLGDPSKRESLPPAERTPLRELIERRAFERAKAYHREKDLTLDLEGLDWPAPADRADKILSELIDNAFKFSLPGSPVAIRAREEQGQNLFLIRDQGRGMTPEQLKKIGAHVQFDRHIYEQQGSGLGLMIAEGLARIHGGALDLQSAPQHGTEVRVSFPSARP